MCSGWGLNSQPQHCSARHCLRTTCPPITGSHQYWSVYSCWQRTLMSTPDVGGLSIIFRWFDCSARTFWCWMAGRFLLWVLSGGFLCGVLPPSKSLHISLNLTTGESSCELTTCPVCTTGLLLWRSLFSNLMSITHSRALDSPRSTEFVTSKRMCSRWGSNSQPRHCSAGDCLISTARWPIAPLEPAGTCPEHSFLQKQILKALHTRRNLSW